MPTEESRKKFIDWFKKYHCKEKVFFTMIESNLEKIYSKNQLGLHEEEYAQISLNIKKSKQDKYHLVADPFTVIFLGSTCKTIMDEISNNMEAIISDRIQQEFDDRMSSKCTDCNTPNLTDAKYCNQCGKILESS
ncbi:MAG: hypothetical protein R2685_01070 [Candidatus Nitrosocosmicus sp.]|nr:hypothetical protein [Candidatus Nitrosocosmicus sp.]